MVGKVVHNLLLNVKDGGHLMLGHSEAINAHDFGLSQRGHSIYFKNNEDAERAARRIRPRVLCLESRLPYVATMQKHFMNSALTPLCLAPLGSDHLPKLHDADLITVDLKLPTCLVKNGCKWKEPRAAHTIVFLSDMSEGFSK